MKSSILAQLRQVLHLSSGVAGRVLFGINGCCSLKFKPFLAGAITDNQIKVSGDFILLTYFRLSLQLFVIVILILYLSPFTHIVAGCEILHQQFVIFFWFFVSLNFLFYRIF